MCSSYKLGLLLNGLLRDLHKLLYACLKGLGPRMFVPEQVKGSVYAHVAAVEHYGPNIYNARASVNFRFCGVFR